MPLSRTEAGVVYSVHCEGRAMSRMFSGQQGGLKGGERKILWLSVTLCCSGHKQGYLEKNRFIDSQGPSAGFSPWKSVCSFSFSRSGSQILSGHFCYFLIYQGQDRY